MELQSSRPCAMWSSYGCGFAQYWYQGVDIHHLNNSTSTVCILPLISPRIIYKDRDAGLAEPHFVTGPAAISQKHEPIWLPWSGTAVPTSNLAHMLDVCFTMRNSAQQCATAYKPSYTRGGTEFQKFH